MHRVTLIEGDGIGPEITAATLAVIEASGVKIEWEKVDAGQNAIDQHGSPLPDFVLKSLKNNGVGLKGPLTTPVGSGFRSINVTLRQDLNLYANLRPVKSLPGVPSLFKDIDLVIVRENTEDLYSGVEHMVGEDAAESIKIITRKASQRIAQFAFDYAVRYNRKKVTAIHKANILKISDGLFLNVARSVAEAYPQIEFDDLIVDNAAMQLVLNPHRFDLLVAPNLYGDILSDLCAGLIGGLGLTPGINIGDQVSLFEPVHGSAPDIAGKNLANPTAMILSSLFLLRHLGEDHAAGKIEDALNNHYREGKTLTADLGGSASTESFGAALAERVAKSV